MRRKLNFPLTFNSPIMFNLDMKHIMHAVPHYWESIQFIVAQFSLYLLVALPCKFTSSTETSLERAIVLLKLKTDTSTKLLPHEIAKYPKSTIISQHEFK